MKNSLQTVQQMADLQQYGNSNVLTLGNVTVKFFKPYTRTTWEFTVDGVVTERRYTAKSAAAYWCTLHQ